MKHPKKAERSKSPPSAARGGKSRRIRKPKDDRMTELLKTCLQKVCELQHDLERTEDYENDPQTAGYAACAVETLRFLSAEGLSNDHPVVKAVTEKLLLLNKDH